MNERVVTELIIDASGSVAGAGQYISAMKAAEKERDRVADSEYKVQQAQEKTVATMTGYGNSIATVRQDFEKLRAKADPVFATQIRHNQALEKAVMQTTAAIRRGITTEVEGAAVISAIRDRQVAEIAELKAAQAGLGAVGGRGAGSFNSANIAAQVQDIGVTTAMGMNPLQIALQQGTQLSAVFESMKANGQSAASAIGMAFRSILSPMSLITIGVIAAGSALVQYFTGMRSGSKDAEESLKKQSDLIDGVVRRWGGALPSLKSYNDELARQKDLSQALEASRAIGNQEFDQFRTGSGLFSMTTSQIDALRIDMVDLISQVQGAGVDPDKIIQLQTAFENLSEGIADSTATGADAVAVQTRLNEMYRSSGIPVIEEYAAQYGTLAEQIDKASQKQAKIIGEGAALKLVSSLNSLDPLNGFRRTPFQDEEELMFERGRAKQAEKDAEALRDQEEAYADLIERQRSAIEVARAELVVFSQGEYARDRLVAAMEAEQEIRALGIDKYGAEADAIRKNAADLAMLEEQYKRTDAANERWQERAELRDDIRFDAAQLQRSPIEQAVAGQLRGTGLGMESVEAEMIRANEYAAQQIQMLDDLISEVESGTASINELIDRGFFIDYASIADAVRIGIVSGMAQDRQSYSISTTNPIQKQINELEEMLEVAGSAAAKAIRAQIRELELELYLSKRGRDLGGIGGQRVSYAGKFAEGGSFVVPGPSSGDKSRVVLDANGGERVTVARDGGNAKPTVVIHQTYQPAPGETERTSRQNMRHMAIEAFREVGRI